MSHLFTYMLLSLPIRQRMDRGMPSGCTGRLQVTWDILAVAEVTPRQAVLARSSGSQCAGTLPVRPHSRLLSG